MKTRRVTPEEMEEYRAYTVPKRKKLHKLIIDGGGRCLSDEARMLVNEIAAWERANGFMLTHQGVRKIR